MFSTKAIITSLIVFGKVFNLCEHYLIFKVRMTILSVVKTSNNEYRAIGMVPGTWQAFNEYFSFHIFPLFHSSHLSFLTNIIIICITHYFITDYINLNIYPLIKGKGHNLNSVRSESNNIMQFCSYFFHLKELCVQGRLHNSSTKHDRTQEPNSAKQSISYLLCLTS